METQLASQIEGVDLHEAEISQIQEIEEGPSSAGKDEVSTSVKPETTGSAAAASARAVKSMGAAGFFLSLFPLFLSLFPFFPFFLLLLYSFFPLCLSACLPSLFSLFSLFQSIKVVKSEDRETRVFISSIFTLSSFPLSLSISPFARDPFLFSFSLHCSILTLCE
jgi:hypothetical protein